MQISEVLIFRDYSSLEEPALMTPFGFMSLRNLAVICIFGILSGALYKLIMPANMSIMDDWLTLCVVFTPLIVGVILATIKTPFGSSDAVLLFIIMLMVRQMLQKDDAKKSLPKNKNKKTKAEPSGLLGLPRNILSVVMPVVVEESQDTSNTSLTPDTIDTYSREIICADLDELKSIRITLHTGDGSIMPDTLVRCYLDGEIFDTLRTSAEGVVVLHVRPEREGGRTLTITTMTDQDNKSVVILRKRLQFVLRRR